MRGTLGRVALSLGLVFATVSSSAADDLPPPIDLDAPAAIVAAPMDDSVALDESAKMAKRAMARYEADGWAEARKLFIAAFELYPHPQYLFYIGDTHRREGAFRMALIYYHRFLESAAPSSWLRPEAEDYTETLHRAISRRAGRIEADPRRMPGLAGGPGPNPATQTPAPMTPMTPMDDSDPRRTTKLAFAVSGIVTASAAIFWGYSGSRVLHFEDEKEEALFDAAQSGVTFNSADACRDAEDRSGAAAARVDDACTSGQRWAIATNTALATTLIGVGLTSYLGYRAYIAGPDRDDRAAVRVAPSVGPTSVGVTGVLEF